MGFGLQQLKTSTADNAKQAAVDVRSMEAQDASSASSGVSRSSSPSAEQPTHQTHFGSGDMPVPSSSALQSAPLASSPATSSRLCRPSFGMHPAKQTSPGRPSFDSGRPMSTLPSLKGVFMRDPNKLGMAVTIATQSGSLQSCPQQAGTQQAAPSLDHNVPNLPWQSLFEIVCTHRKMTLIATHAAKKQAIERPDAVYAQMLRVYNLEIAPHRNKHANDLEHAREQNPGKVVFLLRKDGRERCRAMSMEDAQKTGELILDGATIESVQAASTPFPSPSELFLKSAQETILPNQTSELSSPPEPLEHNQQKFEFPSRPPKP